MYGWFRFTKWTFGKLILRTLGLIVAVSIVAACAPTGQAPTTAPPAAPTMAQSSPAAAQPTTAPAAAPTAAPAVKPAASAAFPTKPITLIIPFSPGGGFDALSRTLASAMEKQLGQPVVVKNVVGGSQRIAAREFQRSAPDGYTLGYFGDPELYAGTLVQPADGFDVNSWVWVAGVEVRDALVYVSGNSPYQTVEDLIAAGRQGERIRFGHNGIGGYLPMQVVFASVTGITNAAMIGGYQGTADLIPALVRGDTDVQVLSEVSSALKFVESGDLRPLVTLGTDRVASLPDVKTAQEANLPDLPALNALSTSYGIVAPPGTPTEVIAILQDAVRQSYSDPAFLKWGEESGKKDQLRFLTADEIVERKKLEYANYGNNAEAIKRFAGG